jgi:hypothetical protein
MLFFKVEENVFIALGKDLYINVGNLFSFSLSGSCTAFCLVHGLAKMNWG